MHNAPDRDNFIKINENNVEDFAKSNYLKYASKDISHFGEKYDYTSVMHYEAYGFSKNGKPTIEPLVSLN